MVDLSIVIVNYNVKEFLKNLLNSLKKATAKIQTEIIVVDNDSSDGSCAMLKKYFPEVDLISNSENIGFGAANNLALEKARGKYIALVNPDVIVSEDVFEKLIDFMNSNKEVGLSGCKVLNSDGTLQFSCRRSFPSIWTSFTKITGLSKLFPKNKFFAKYNLTYLDENKSYEVDAVSGAFMFFRKECYNKVGGFDPIFFMYGEDLDLCYRVQQSGYKVFYFHSTQIIHYKGESTKRSNIDDLHIFYEAMNLFVKKHLASSILIRLMLSISIRLREIIEFIRLNKLIFGSVFLDYLLLIVLLMLSELLYLGSNEKQFPGIVKPWVYFIPTAFQLLISMFLGVYQKSKIHIIKLYKSLFLGSIILSSFVFFFNQFAYSRVVLLLYYAFAFVVLTLMRIIYLGYKNHLQLNQNIKPNVVIVGTGEQAMSIADKLTSNVESLDNIIGFIGTSMKEVGYSMMDIQVIGSIENLNKLIKPNNIQKIIFSSDEISSQKMFEVISSCNKEDVEFNLAGKDIEYLVGKSSVTLLDNLPLLKIDYNINKYSNKVLKVLLDYIIALPMLFFFYIPAKIKHLNGDKKDEYQLLLNLPKVLSRKFSLVGPRESKGYFENYPIKPGLTGLWYIDESQILNEIQEKKLNIYYAKNQNIWLDLEILRKSFIKMKNRGNNGKK